MDDIMDKNLLRFEAVDEFSQMRNVSEIGKNEPEVQVN